MKDNTLNCPRCKKPMETYLNIFMKTPDGKFEYPCLICTDKECGAIRSKEYVYGFWNGWEAKEREQC